MTIDIPADLQQFVDQILHHGGYESEADVVGCALRLLQERERRIEQLRRDIQPAMDELDRGEGIELTSEEDVRQFFDDIKTRGHERRDTEQRGQ